MSTSGEQSAYTIHGFKDCIISHLKLCAGETPSRVFSIFFEKNQMDSQG